MGLDYEKSFVVWHFGIANRSKYYNTHEHQSQLLLNLKTNKHNRWIHMVEMHLMPITKPYWIQAMHSLCSLKWRECLQAATLRECASALTVIVTLHILPHYDEAETLTFTFSQTALHPMFVFTNRDKELKMSTPTMKMNATMEENNETGEENWGSSYLDR